MVIIFSKVALNQLKKFKRITQDDVKEFVAFLIADENFQKSLKQAAAEGESTDPLVTAFYVPEANITITLRLTAELVAVEVLEVKRGNHMSI